MVAKIKWASFLAFLLLVFNNCTGSAGLSTSGKSSNSAAPQASQYINADTGGTLQLGANMTLSIPAGALDKSVEITAAQIAAPAGAEGVQPLAAYEFGEHGLQFHRPAILKMCYPAAAIQGQGLNEDSMAIYHNDTSGYVSYGGTVDKTNHCVTTEIFHFSTYFVAAQQLLTTNTAPLVGGVSTIPSTPMIGLPLKLRSVITDFNAGGRGQVASAWLHYCVGLPSTSCGATGTFQKVPLSPDLTSTVTPNRYAYTLPANLVTNAGITYFIEAIDNLRKPNNPVTGFRTITVTPTGLTITPASLDIAAGFSREFTVQVVPPTGPALDIDYAAINVNNGIGTAALNNQGVLVFNATTSGDPLTTGYRSGSVTATVGSLSATANINVWPGKLTAIQILDSTGVVLGSNITLAPGATFDFDARGLDAFGNFSLVYPAWIVTNPLVGSIPNNDGLFNASGNDGQNGSVLAIVDNIAGSVNINLVAPPTVTLGVAGSPFSENGGVATLTAYLSQTYASPVTVNLAFSGTALPADYIAANNSITIPAGQLSGDVTLTGVDNALFEGNKTVVVDIASVVNGIESGVQQVTAVIQDDETAPFVTGATPLEGSSGNPITTQITLTFSQPMNGATLTLSTTNACTGAIQVSTVAANFTTCVAMNASLAVLGNGGTLATLTPAASLAYNTTYKIRITAAAQGANGAPLANPVTSPNGWSTELAPVTNQLNGNFGINFGSCIRGSGDYVLIGQPGMFHIYKKTGSAWVEIQQIPGELTVGHNNACAFNGAYVAIPTDSTTVQIYKNNGSDTFINTATLTGFDPGLTSISGGAIAINGDTLVVGSIQYNVSGHQLGAAFVFAKDAIGENWNLTQRLEPSSLGNPITSFGSAITTNGSVIAVTQLETGLVDIFEKDVSGVWQNQGSFNPGIHDAESIAISASGVLAIGAIRSSVITMSQAGVVFIIEKDGFNNWVQTAKIEAADAMAGDDFGFSVAIDGNTLAVGAAHESGGNGDLFTDPLYGRGSVYTFQRDVSGVWQQISKYEQPTPITGDPDGRRADLQGFAVGIANGAFFGGAPYTINTSGPQPAAQTGTVWIYPTP